MAAEDALVPHEEGDGATTTACEGSVFTLTDLDGDEHRDYGDGEEGYEDDEHVNTVASTAIGEGDAMDIDA